MNRNVMFAFCDYIDGMECWDETGFYAQRKSAFPKQCLYVFGAWHCYDFFITNGLWGLLDCEYGKMFPEFIVACKYLGCSESAVHCKQTVFKLYSNNFPRSDYDRKRGMGSETILEVLDCRGETLDLLLQHEKCFGRFHSFCKCYCDKYKVPYEIGPVLKGYTEFEAPVNFWERSIDTCL